jgi:D-alanine transaminase
MTEPLANLDGQILPLAEARISALDRGFLFGDAVYEVLRVYQGRPWLEQEHFQRFASSLQAIQLTGVDLDRLRQRMHQTLVASGCAEATIYLQITRGNAPRSHAFPVQVKPLEFLFVQPFTDPYREQRLSGGRAVLQPDIRWGRCDIKSTNLLGNVLAMQAARQAGCMEAILFLPDGGLTEATHSSLFGVSARGTLLTAPRNPGILPGITRDLVLRLAQKLGIPTQEQAMSRKDLSTLAELFLTGTTSEVMPLIEVAGQEIGTGQPGPITRRLQEAYRAAVQGFLSATSAAT